MLPRLSSPFNSGFLKDGLELLLLNVQLVTAFVIGPRRREQVAPFSSTIEHAGGYSAKAHAERKIAFTSLW